MQDRSFRKAKPRRQALRGFTLLELLIVVAIVVVLSALAIPLIDQSKTDLESAELDAVARQIFIAAQNKSTAMLALGTFDDFDASEGAPAQLPDSVPQPGDYHYAAHADLTKDYLAILPAGSIDPTVLSDPYYIEYNAKTGDIYGVFYAKEPFDYQDAVLLRGQAERKTEDGVRIGYFGGVLGAGLETVRTKAPDFKLVNGEELYVRFAHIDAGTVYTLTVADATSPHTEPLYFRIDTNSLLGSRIKSEPTVSGAVVKLPMKVDVDGSLCILLDSLDESANPNFSSRRFKDNFTDGDGHVLLTPGHDLYLSGKAQKALVETETEKILYLESDEVAYFANSLFDSATREKGKNESVSAHNFRHLQNLDAASGYVPMTALFEAKLTAPLDWKDADARKGTVGYVPPETLTAISNEALLVFDGQGNAIENAPLGVHRNGASTDGTAGLFGVFTGHKDGALKRIRLVDARLAPAQDAAVTHAGLLVGKVSGEAAIIDCRTYATADGGTANPACAAELPKSVLYAGGLIGAMQRGTVTDCFASIPAFKLLDDKPAESRLIGGLIGSAKNVALERCYSNIGALRCAMGGKQDKLGGLVGLADGGKFDACYASGVIDLDGAEENCQLSGFANVQSNPAVSACYTAVTYGEGLYAPALINPDDSDLRANNGAKVFPFADAPKGQSADGRYYLRTEGVTEFCTDAGQTYGEGLSYDEMTAAKLCARFSDARWTSADETHTHAYTAAPGAYPFPIPTNTAANAAAPYPLDHYGDWPARQGEKYLVYYEKYKNGQYGFFSGNRVEINSLQNAANMAVVEDGYAVLCETADPAPTLAYRTAAGPRTAALLNSGQPASVKRLADGQTLSCKAWLFPSAALDESVALRRAATPSAAARDSYFHAFAAGGYRFFANPNFAKFLVNGQDMPPAITDEPAPVAIRTSRQLHKLGLPAQNAYWDRAFSQEREIDFSQYPAQVHNQPYPQPIGNSVVPFTGVYDGNRNVINGLNVVVDAESADTAYAGMFGLCTTTARITRVRLQNPAVSGGTDCAGILAGRLTAQRERAGSQNFMISDCYVYAKNSIVAFAGDPGFDGACTLITTAGTVGGLAGSIENSSVCDTLTSPTKIEMGDGDRAGGFAGKLDGANAVIEQCYANTKLFMAGVVGKLGGFAGESTATVRGAYALGELSVKESRPAGFIQANNGSCTDCYTLCTYNQVEDNGLHQTSGYGFSGTATVSRLEQCYYWGTSGLVDSAYGTRCTYEEMKELRTDSLLSLNHRFSIYQGETFRYASSGAFPFAFLVFSDNNVLTANIMPHYGDWPAEAGTYLAYYEKYRDDAGNESFGYYTSAFDFLDNAAERTAQKTIVADGYAILTSATIKQVTYGNLGDTNGDGKDEYRELILGTDTERAEVWEKDGVSFTVYRFKPGYETDTIMGMGEGTTLAEQLRDSTLDNNLRSSFYYRVGIDGAVYYFNPCFAKTVTPTLTLEPTAPVSIRTARQFQCLSRGRSDYKYWGWSAFRVGDGSYRPNAQTFLFKQEHDIDGDSACIQPIGTPDRQLYFRNSYDGGCYTLRDFSVSRDVITTQHVGLFGYNTGNLSNIFFIAEDDCTVSGSNYVGAIAGTNAGTITNCFAAGFNVTASSVAGGFVGSNTGTITQCAAVQYTRGGSGGSVGYNGGGTGGMGGGFVCENSGTILNCFAITTNTCQNRQGFVVGNSGGGSIKNCYCASPIESGYLPFGGSVSLDGCVAYNGTNYSDAFKSAFGGCADAAHTHPFDTGLKDTASPWPTFVRDHTGNAPVFFGNWMTVS